MRSLLNRLLLAMAVGHFAVDLNANLLPVMLPFLRSSLALSYTQTALVVTCYTMTSSMVQPIFGYLSDRVGGRWLPVVPIVWMVAFMGSAGYAESYPALIVLVTLAGLGAAAFHPQGAANARRAGGVRVATAVSVFSLGGIAGYSLGPMAGAAVFTSIGLRGTLLFVPVGLVAALVVAILLAGGTLRGQDPRRLSGEAAREPVAWGVLGSLLFVVVMRAWVEYGIVAYTPLRFAGELMRSSQLLFFFLLGEALGTFLGALAADSVGRRRVIVASTLLLAPAIYLYNVVPGGLALFAAAILAGLLLGSSIPVTIVMAQELLPRNVGMASGLMMGFAFGMGGLGIAVNGALADRYGLATSLSLLAVLPVLGAVVASTFPASLEGRSSRAALPTRRADQPGPASS